MRDLNQIMQECREELEKIGIQPGTVVNVSVNNRAKRHWGQCIRVGNGFNITISYRLMEESVDIIHLKTTMIHELLHTVKGCHGHTGLWLTLANKVNRMYPQYDIKRCTSSEEKGLKPIVINRNEIIHYRFRCMGCGQIIERYRASKFTKNYNRYRCGVCHGRFEQI